MYCRSIDMYWMITVDLFFLMLPQHITGAQLCSIIIFYFFFQTLSIGVASPPQTPHSQSAFGLRVEDEPKEVNVWVTKSAPARQWRHLCHTLGYWGVRIYLEDLQNMWNLLGNSEIMTATIEKGWHLGKCRKMSGKKVLRMRFAWCGKCSHTLGEYFYHI